MIEKQYLDDATAQLRKLKAQADKALAQTSDDHLFATLDPESNSIAIIMKHVAGNMRSRWTDFLTSDGEKPDRHRDTEFELAAADTRARDGATFTVSNMPIRGGGSHPVGRRGGVRSRPSPGGIPRSRRS